MNLDLEVFEEMPSNVVNTLKTMNKYTPAAFKHFNIKAGKSKNNIGLIIPLTCGVKFYSLENKNWCYLNGGKAELIGNTNFEKLNLLEGEFDLFSAYENGIENVITGTGGAGTFKKEWTNLLNKKEVVITYDNDKAGREGAQKVAKLLSEAGGKVFIASLPSEFEEAEDVRDFFTKYYKTKSDFMKLIENAKEFVEDEEKLPPPEFVNNENGLHILGPNESLIWICSPIRIIGTTRSVEQKEWGIIVEFYDPDKSLHQVRLTQAELLDNTKTLQKLVSEGLRISPNKGHQNKLLAHLLKSEDMPRIRIISKCGWVSDSCYYLNGYGAIGEIEETIWPNKDLASKFAIKQYGSLEDWKNNLGRLFQGNSISILCSCLGLSAPLLKIFNHGNFGIALIGPSSTGKTTILKLIASLFGPKTKGEESFIRSWRTTDNGLEGICLDRNDLLLPLDEIGEIDPTKLLPSIYLLGNGEKKVRASKSGESTEKKSFRLTFLSTGETSMKQHIKGLNISLKGGHEVRLIEIQANVSQEFGCFENIHEFESSKYFVDHINKFSGEFYGTPFAEFLIQLIGQLKNKSEFMKKMDSLRNEFNEIICVKKPSPYISRILSNFSVLYCAGRLGVEFNILPISIYDLNNSLNRIAHEVIGSIDEHTEINQILSVVRYFFQGQGTSRFEQVPTTPDGNTTPYSGYPFIRERAGIVGTHKNEDIYMVFPDVFEKDVCRNHFPRRVYDVLYQKNFLIRDSEGKNTVPKHYNNGTTRFVLIKKTIIN